jgi:imidazolonepropionase-like amidohydrolase
MLDLAVSNNIISLPSALKLATYNPSEAIPAFSKQRGLLKEGYIADIVVSSPRKLSDVKQVFTGGRLSYFKD